MAFTRKFLNGLKGKEITDEVIETLIEAHSEPIDALKAERDAFKEKALQLDAVQQELNEIKAKGDEGWQTKYEEEHSAFETFKAAQTEKENKANKAAAVRKLYKDAGIADKFLDLVMKASDMNAFKLGEDGKLVDVDKLTESVKAEYADFIGTTQTAGAAVENPPAGASGKIPASQLRGHSTSEINQLYSSGMIDFTK